MPGIELGLGTCWIHHGVFEFDPYTVVGVQIDPQTKRPPDVAADGTPLEQWTCTIDQCILAVICDPCVTQLNRARAARGLPVWQTSADRRNFGQDGWAHE